jgi:signal transduction histidine kinase
MGNGIHAYCAPVSERHEGVTDSPVRARVVEAPDVSRQRGGGRGAFREVAIRSVDVVQALEVDGPAPRVGASGGDLARRADVAGRALFARPTLRGVARGVAAAALELAALDVAVVSLPVQACDHPRPCRRPDCPRRLRPAAVAGERSGPLREAVLARASALAAGGGPIAIAPEARGAEDDAPLVLPIAFGGASVGVLLGATRGRGAGPGRAEALARLVEWAGPALAAAGDRERAEERARRIERRRLVRALHDDLGQQLFAVRSATRSVREGAAAAGADLRARIDAMERAVEAAEAALRVTMTTLAPLSTGGGPLGVVLGEQAAAFTARTGVPAQVIVLGEPVPIGAEARELLARAAREGLRNVERHAGASEVIVTLRADAGSAELTVQDDGTGPPREEPPGRLGLRLLREQVARQGGGLRLARNDDAGATLRVWLPVT